MLRHVCDDPRHTPPPLGARVCVVSRDEESRVSSRHTAGVANRVSSMSMGCSPEYFGARIAWPIFGATLKQVCLQQSPDGSIPPRIAKAGCLPDLRARLPALACVQDGPVRLVVEVGRPFAGLCLAHPQVALD